MFSAATWLLGHEGSSDFPLCPARKEEWMELLVTECLWSCSWLFWPWDPLWMLKTARKKCGPLPKSSIFANREWIGGVRGEGAFACLQSYRVMEAWLDGSRDWGAPWVDGVSLEVPRSVGQILVCLSVVRIMFWRNQSPEVLDNLQAVVKGLCWLSGTSQHCSPCAQLFQPEGENDSGDKTTLQKSSFKLKYKCVLGHLWSSLLLLINASPSGLLYRQFGTGQELEIIAWHFSLSSWSCNMSVKWDPSHTAALRMSFTSHASGLCSELAPAVQVGPYWSISHGHTSC